MQISGKLWKAVWLAAASFALTFPANAAKNIANNAANDFVALSFKQDQATGTLTPRQFEIEKQRQRLSSGDVEERREALTQLGSMHHTLASRAALAGLADATPIVRATATAAVLSLPPEEAAASLAPLLNDKDEFVRQQAAYALGQTRSRTAVAPLIIVLSDKKESVRGAAAVALGQIGDATAVTSLAGILDPQFGLAPSKKSKKKTREQNLFVLRAAAHSLGEIGNRAGLPALIGVLQDEKAESDVRREAAFALGEIGDAAALPALRGVEAATDPYLSGAAHEAIRRISRSQIASD